jgi:hypothetical protein
VREDTTARPPIEYLRATLKQEEERLRVLRQKPAAALNTQVTPTEKIVVSRVSAVMNDLAAVAGTALGRGLCGRGDAEK